MIEGLFLKRVIMFKQTRRRLPISADSNKSSAFTINAAALANNHDLREEKVVLTMTSDISDRIGLMIP